MSDLYNILAVISIGDSREDVTALVNVLRQLSLEEAAASRTSGILRYRKPWR